MKLLIVSSVRWHFLWQRHHAIAMAAAEAGWEVDFVDPPVRGPAHARSAVWSRLRRSDDTPVTNPLPSGVRLVQLSHGFAFLPARYQQAHLRALLRPPYDACVLYLPMMSLVEFAALAAHHLAYDNVLDWRTAPAAWFPPRDWRSAEAVLEKQPWQRMTDSPAVAASYAARGVSCTWVPPAADAPFHDYRWRDPVPGGPIVYFGMVREQEVDLTLLCRLASQGVEVQTVGPIPEESAARHLAAAGVHCTPTVVSSDLPALVDRSAALILPYATARGDTLMPAKLWNCLATNRPLLVRGLQLPEVIAGEFVDLAADDSVAIATITEIQRRPVARRPRPEAWADRWTLVEQVLEGRA